MDGSRAIVHFPNCCWRGQQFTMEMVRARSLCHTKWAAFLSLFTHSIGLGEIRLFLYMCQLKDPRRSSTSEVFSRTLQVIRVEWFKIPVGTIAIIAVQILGMNGLFATKASCHNNISVVDPSVT
jgi:hypothetical protein